MKNSKFLTGAFLLIAAGFGIYYLFHTKTANHQKAEPDTVTEVPVHVGSIQQTDLHSFIEVYGRVDSVFPASGQTPSQVPVTSALGGVLTEIDTSVCSLGMSVSKGQVLLHLDSRLADIELSQAKNQLQYAQQQLQRTKQLLQAQAASEKDYQDALLLADQAKQRLQTAQTQRNYLDIQAPISGTIVQLMAVSDQTVSAGQTLAVIRDDSRLFITAEVPSIKATGLHINQEVVIYVPTGQNKRSFSYQAGTGKVVYIAPEVNAETDSIRVQIQPDNESSLNFKKGQLIRLQIEQEMHTQCLAVNVEAVVRDADGKSYIAVVDGNTANRCYVSEGIRQGDLVEIEGDGLAAGMTVVTQGAYGLPESSGIKVLNE